MSSRQSTLFREWMRQFLDWLEIDPQAVAYAASLPDHEGVYFDIMCAAVAFFVHDEATTLYHINTATSRMRAHFNEHFDMVRELSKNRCEALRVADSSPCG